MIIYQGREFYPLDIDSLVKYGKVYYDRSARGKNYFYLDLRTGTRSEEQINEQSSGLSAEEE